MSEAIYVPIIAIVYLVLMVWYSTIMAKVLNTNLVVLIIVGIFLAPIWLIMALVSLSYQMSGSRDTSRRTSSPSPVKRSRSKSPKRGRSKSPKRKSPSKK